MWLANPLAAAMCLLMAASLTFVSASASVSDVKDKLLNPHESKATFRHVRLWNNSVSEGEALPTYGFSPIKARKEQETRRRATSSPFQVASRFPGPSYADNLNITGNIFIPPKPDCAASNTTLISVVNDIIQFSTKQGNVIFQTGLASFFGRDYAVNGTVPVAPLIAFDEYEDRFVLVALQQITPDILNPNGVSNILVGVSKSGSPTGSSDWFFLSIDASEIGPDGPNLQDIPGEYFHFLSCADLEMIVSIS